MSAKGKEEDPVLLAVVLATLDVSSIRIRWKGALTWQSMTVAQIVVTQSLGPLS